jgi:hypothetical protein
MAQRERESRLAGREDLEDLGATMPRNAENWRRARRLLSVRAYDEMLAGASPGPGRRQARAFAGAICKYDGWIREPAGI